MTLKILFASVLTKASVSVVLPVSNHSTALFSLLIYVTETGTEAQNIKPNCLKTVSHFSLPVETIDVQKSSFYCRQNMSPNNSGAVQQFNSPLIHIVGSCETH